MAAINKERSRNWTTKMPSEKELERIKLWGEIITLIYRIAELEEKLKKLED
jgi:hypothetical protein